MYFETPAIERFRTAAAITLSKLHLEKNTRRQIYIGYKTQAAAINRFSCYTTNESNAT